MAVAVAVVVVVAGHRHSVHAPQMCAICSHAEARVCRVAQPRRLECEDQRGLAPRLRLGRAPCQWCGRVSLPLSPLQICFKTPSVKKHAPIHTHAGHMSKHEPLEFRRFTPLAHNHSMAPSAPGVQPQSKMFSMKHVPGLARGWSGRGAAAAAEMERERKGGERHTHTHQQRDEGGGRVVVSRAVSKKKQSAIDWTLSESRTDGHG